MRTYRLAVGLCLLLPAVVRAQGDDLTALSLEVVALQTLQDLDLEPDQLKAVAKLAKGAAGEKPAAQTVKASAELGKALKDLRAALVKGDDEKISDLQAKLDDLREKENVELPEKVAASPTARKRASQFMKLLTVRQLGGLIGGLELVGPRDRLIQALEDVRGLPADQFKEVRDEAAAEVGWLAAGFDAKKAEDISKKASALLDEAYRLKDPDFNKQQPALEKKARSLIGTVDNMRVLTHILEHHLAEVLSNPALEKALEVFQKR
jgi:hypothetical protein